MTSTKWSVLGMKTLPTTYFHICVIEFVWRETESVNCRLYFFKEKTDNTGRIKYNPTFSNTTLNTPKADRKRVLARNGWYIIWLSKIGLFDYSWNSLRKRVFLSNLSTMDKKCLVQKHALRPCNTISKQKKKL